MLRSSSRFMDDMRPRFGTIPKDDSWSSSILTEQLESALACRHVAVEFEHLSIEFLEAGHELRLNLFGQHARGDCEQHVSLSRHVATQVIAVSATDRYEVTLVLFGPFRT